MVCKHCGASLEDGQTVCPLCGMDPAQEPAGQSSEATASEELFAELDGQEDQEAPDAAAETGEDQSGQEPETDPSEHPMTQTQEEDGGELPEEPAAKPKKNFWILGILIVVLLAAVAVLVVMLLRPKGATVPDLEYVDENGAFVEHDFTKPVEEVTEEMANQVVATCGDYEMTNVTLSYYYWQLYNSALNSYGSYVTMFFDPSQSLATQMLDETHSWQDMYLEQAVTSFQQNATLATLANAEGITLSEEQESYLTTLRDSITQAAEANSFASADELIQLDFGPYASVDSYLEHARMTFLAQAYLEEKFQNLDYTEADVEAYYDENAETYAADGVEKDDTKLIDIRHILIQPTADADAEVDESGNVVWTEENWAAAEAEAEELLAQWKAGEATEESFAELAKEHSVDGSASNGGLYTGVYPGQMITEFNDWCFADGRQVGDTGIVKTSYGYHIMYFSGFGDQDYWYLVAESDYISDRQRTMLEEMVAGQPFRVYYDRAVLTEPDAG